MPHINQEGKELLRFCTYASLTSTSCHSLCSPNKESRVMPLLKNKLIFSSLFLEECSLGSGIFPLDS